MNRLTLKCMDPFTNEENYYPNVVFEENGKKMLDMTKQMQCNNKLGQLEDIEEEFGIDLVKILTAKEVYTFDTEVVAPHKLGRTNKIVKCSIFYFDFTNKVIHIHVPKIGLYCMEFLNYGKTWAFTREELKK